MKINDINQIRCFNLIYQTRNITKAANHLKISKVAMAKRLSLLESDIGYKLFKRSTRSITPTIEADNLYRETVKLLDHIEEIQNLFSDENELKGLIRVTCSTTVARDFLAKILLDFQEKHSQIIVELIVTDSQLDLVENNIDLAIRVNPNKNSNLIGRKICDYKLIFVASPLILKNRKYFESLEDIKNFRLLYADIYQDLTIIEDKVKLKNVTAVKSFRTSDPETLTQTALSGKAISLRPDWSVKKFLREKKLVQILKNKTLNHFGEVWLLHGSGKLQSHRVKLLGDFIHDRLKQVFES